jgi:hypothetical protein
MRRRKKRERRGKRRRERRRGKRRGKRRRERRRERRRGKRRRRERRRSALHPGYQRHLQEPPAAAAMPATQHHRRCYQHCQAVQEARARVGVKARGGGLHLLHQNEEA